MKTLQTLLLGLLLAASTNGARAHGRLLLISNMPEGFIQAVDDSTEQIEDVSNLAINRAYPGPVISDVHVDVSSGAETVATIKLIDLAGRTAMERPVKLVSGENHFDINMDDLSGGLYQLIVQTDNKRVAYKLVKVR